MNTLKPYKHKQFAFFIADDIQISAYRDEIGSMEHPFFALKGGDTKIREYKNGKVTLTIRATAGIGLATIFDKDIWIYAISKLQEAINNNQQISRTISFTPYDFFITTNREIGGKTYKELEKALERLKGTTVKTNIIYSKDTQKTIGFGLIDSWKIIEKKKGKLEAGMVEITLPNWLYQAITRTRVLQINPKYFRIRKAINRRIYEIARKHCGNQHIFQIKIETLYLKTGSTSTLAKFKFNMKQLSKTNDLPDYEILFDSKKNRIFFKNRNIQKRFFYVKKIDRKNILSKKKDYFYDINYLPDPDKKIPEGFRG